MKMGFVGALAAVLLLSSCADSGAGGRLSGWRFLPGSGHAHAMSANCQALATDLQRQKARLKRVMAVEMAESPFDARQDRSHLQTKIDEIRVRMRDLHCGGSAAGSATQLASAPQSAPLTPASTTQPANAHPASAQPAPTQKIATVRGGQPATGSTPAPINPAILSKGDQCFGVCFNRCRIYTGRTKNRCFDVCNAVCKP